MSILISGPVHFGQIPEEHWYPPSWINETKAKEERDKMEEEGVIYGGSLSCVFSSCPAPYRRGCDNGCYAQVSQYVPVQFGGPNFYFSHLPVDLTDPLSSSFVTR